MLRINKDRSLIYNYIIFVAIFRVENNTFTKWLQTVIREDKITQNILKKISLEDIMKFTKEDKFLLF